MSKTRKTPEESFGDLRKLMERWRAHAVEAADSFVRDQMRRAGFDSYTAPGPALFEILLTRFPKPADRLNLSVRDVELTAETLDFAPNVPEVSHV